MTGSLDPARVRAICFDIDGTLADTDDTYIRRLAGWLTPVRFLLPGGDVQRTARQVVMALETPANAFIAGLDRLGMDQLIGPMVDALYRLRGARPAHVMRLIDGARQAVVSLSARYPLAVATARERHSALAFLSVHELERFFRVVATARSARRAKPHPAPVLWVCQQLGVEPAQLLMVGDTVVDIRSARSAGAQTAGLLCGFGKQDELENAGADAIFESPDALARFLLSHTTDAG